jgi:hypothetical protein
MNYLGGKRLALLLSILLFGCAELNPPANNRLFSAKDHKCKCENMPEGFSMDESWVVGGGLWLEHVRLLNTCQQIMEIK